MRIAGFCWPPINTCATPEIWLICWASFVSMLSSTSVSGRVSEVAPSRRMGESAGLTLRYVGGLGRFFGNCPPAALIAACTSFAAASILRSRTNWIVIDVEPTTLVEGICEMPAICANCVSSGWGTPDATGLGLCAGGGGGTVDGGKMDLGERCHRQARIGDEADEQHAHHQQRRGDRQSDEWCGDSPFHDQGSFCVLLAASLSGDCDGFALCGTTSAPSVSRYWPVVTTRSPLARPLRTTLCEVPSSPTSMSRFSTLLSLPTTNA